MNFKKAAAFAGAAAMVLTSVTPFNVFADDVPTVKVTIPTIYELPDQDMVEEAINAITEEKYGVRMDLEFITTGNWQTQSNLLFTGDEADVIAIFMTPLSAFVKNGQLTDLSEYYANASEEFKSVWSAEAMAGTTINGNIYAVPNLRNFGNIMGLNIDVDVAAEFGIEDGQTLTMEEVDAFLRGVAEKYPERYPMVPQGGTSLISEWSWDGLGDAKWLGVLPDCGQTTEVQNLFETDDFVDFCTWTHSWYQDGLIMQDILSNTQAWQTLILNDQAVSCFDNYANNAAPGCIRTKIVDAWAQSNSYQALCYGINQNSSKKDDSWKVMEILYTDPEVGTLLTNGIEGVHYILNEDGTASFPEGKTAADCGYGMGECSWIVPYAGFAHPTDLNGPTFFEDLIQFNNDTLKTKGFGFSFDTSVVIDQYSACSNIMDKYYAALMAGTVDVESTIEQANAEFEAAGLADIIAAKQEQLDAFLAASAE